MQDFVVVVASSSHLNKSSFSLGFGGRLPNLLGDQGPCLISAGHWAETDSSLTGNVSHQLPWSNLSAIY